MTVTRTRIEIMKRNLVYTKIETNVCTNKICKNFNDYKDCNNYKKGCGAKSP